MHMPGTALKPIGVVVFLMMIDVRHIKSLPASLAADLGKSSLEGPCGSQDKQSAVAGNVPAQ